MPGGGGGGGGWGNGQVAPAGLRGELEFQSPAERARPGLWCLQVPARGLTVSAGLSCGLRGSAGTTSAPAQSAWTQVSGAQW